MTTATKKSAIKIVKESNRLNFIPKHLGIFGVQHFENLVYAITEKNDKNYNGGYWEFAEVGDGFFMYPSEERMYSAHSDYSICDTLDNIAFGMLVSFLALDQMMWELHRRGKDTDKIINQWHALKNMLLDYDAEQLYPIID